jgi:protein TonB
MQSGASPAHTHHPIGKACEQVVDHPSWMRRPNGSDFTTYFPPTAIDPPQEGHTVMQCEITPSGFLAGCVIAKETAPEMGYGEASLKLARMFRARPSRKPTKCRQIVIIPISWKFAD